MKKKRTVLFILNFQNIIKLGFLIGFIVLFASFTGYGAGKQGLLNQGELEKGILVEQNVSLGDPVWCGRNAFAITNKRLGVRWIDLVKKKVVQIHQSPYVGAVDCTPDGKWLIYVDSQNSRYDKGTYASGVVDLWRYNLETGQRQKFVIAQGGGKWSPDGKKFLLYGSRPKSSIEQPVPKWELVWSQKEWPVGGGFRARWLANSSSVIIKSADKLYIERFDTKDAIKLINIDLGDIGHLKVDRFNRIYLISRGKKGLEKARLLRCLLKGDTLECEDALKRNNPISEYDITGDGEQIVFLEKGNNCVWDVRSGSTEARCVAQQDGPTVSISPDGKWLAFTPYRKIGETYGHDVVENDLFVKKLTNK